MRDKFIFDKYIFDALDNLSGEMYKKCMNVLVKYAFLDEKPTEANEPTEVMSAFILYQGAMDIAKRKIDSITGRQSKEYREWKKAVFDRDEGKCQYCGKKTKLHIHHIKPFGKYPKLRYDLSNGITLCEDCHKGVHKKHGK